MSHLMQAPDTEEPISTDAVCELLRAGIHSGRLVPGQRLVETDLVRDLKTNRSRLREAFRRLQADGLVTIDRNRGASVRRISRQEMIDTMEVLEALTVLMVDKSIGRRQEPDVAATLENALERARAFRDSLGGMSRPRLFMEENVRFWDIFAHIADNPVLTDLRGRLQAGLFRLALDDLDTADKERWIARHEDILSAVIAGERGAARAGVRQAVANVLRAILGLPDDAFAW